MAACSHNIEQHCRLSERNASVNRKKDRLRDELIDPVAAIPIKAQVAALRQALVGEAKPAASAIPTKIHKKDDPGRAWLCSSARPCSHNNAGCLMPWRNRRAIQKLAALRAAQRICTNVKQQLPWPWARD